MGERSLVEVANLHRRYGDVHAVQGLNFRLDRGEVLGFLGPNGAGKTTTMQMICGVLAPSEGAVHIGGVDLLEDPIAAKRQLGYLPEQPPLYRELTVDEYLRYCAQLHGLRNRDAAAAIEETKTRCGLEHVGRRLIGNLSKGYRQRVGIAQAILHRPPVVVLDEPTVGLDPIQIREIRELMSELGDDHGVILSTHILAEVQAVCDRVQILHEGRLVLDEDLAQLSKKQQPRSTRVRMRRPPGREVLAGLAAVTSVEALDAETFRLHHGEDETLGERIAAASAAGDWGLYELVGESRSLEEIFVELTFGEGP
ncbi:MAG: ATP-binding cassette domain-containing protein [Gammaproteobacteria bacterium]|nr:ATP-binding cassette domain-containing protein [Gammaproteobacteria bacterium]NIM72498.1 ATP-binding cassette domain-containing protein [Gammaproteobacteria bacterium]NIO24257.1 ATP-binding cassette domain-containing protein [Gammaproteobacteria bacterium]NIO64862.1 ATP-binding cassette domain-containing protein [Gammaproteobacteria bacterium]NIP44904.1 ABC transporter ATP-binding protein [Gammaproteobacteria bacterium]